MSGAGAFGKLCRDKRLAAEMTLRHFCRENGFDAAYISRLERGVVEPPHTKKTLDRLALALGLKEGSDEWTEFHELASLCAGRLPDEFVGDERVLSLLPVFFRAIGKADVDEARLNRLIERLRKEVP